MTSSRTSPTASGDGPVTEEAALATPLAVELETPQGGDPRGGGATGEAVLPRGKGFIWLGVVASAMAFFGVLAALESGLLPLSRRGQAPDLIDIQSDFEEDRFLVLAGKWPERAEQALVHGWKQLGLPVQLGEDRQTIHVAHRRFFAADASDLQVAGAVAKSGLVREEAFWNHPAISRIPASKAVAVLTTLTSHGGLSSYVFSERAVGDWGSIEWSAFDRIAKTLPEARPGLQIYVDGSLRLSVPLSAEGAPRLSLARRWGPKNPNAVSRSCAAEGEDDPGRDAFYGQWNAVVEMARAQGVTLPPRPSPLFTTELSGDGAPHAVAGWYSHRFERPVMVCGLRRGPRDAIAAWLLSQWISDDEQDGRLSPEEKAFLYKVESMEPVALEGSGPSVDSTMLPRTVGVRFGGSPERGQRFFGTAEGREELRAIRELGFGAICLEVHVPILAPTNRTSLPVAFAEWQGAGSRSVTLEGDAAVLAAAEQARQEGLKVVLWPRILTGPHGGLLVHQVVPSPAHWMELSGRAATTSARVAALAAEMHAEGLVLFDVEQLPTEEEAKVRAAGVENPKLPTFDAMRAVREAILDGAASFSGPKICIAASVRALGLTQRADEFRAAGVKFGLDEAIGLDGPWGDRRNDVSRLSRRFRAAAEEVGPGLQMIQISVPGTNAARRGREFSGGAPDEHAREDYLSILIDSLQEANEVPMIVARGWHAGGGSVRGFDVGRWSEATLRAFTSLR